MTQRHGNPHSIGRLIARELRSGNKLKDPPVGKDADLIERLRTRANVYAERREISMEALLLKAADRLSVMEEAREVLQQIVSMQPRTDVQRHWFAKGAEVLAKLEQQEDV